LPKIFSFDLSSSLATVPSAFSFFSIFDFDHHSFFCRRVHRFFISWSIQIRGHQNG
jgi:hypothetical protein